MRSAMVRHGDPTTTDGRVIAVDSTMFDEGKRIALHDEHASCGNCNGIFKIIGSGTECTENGRATVLHGDPVRCPCGKNKVIAGGDASCYVETSGNAWVNSATNETTPHHASGAATNSQRFLLRDADGQELTHTAYTLRRTTGEIEYGETDGNGYTPLHSAAAIAESVQLVMAG